MFAIRHATCYTVSVIKGMTNFKSKQRENEVTKRDKMIEKITKLLAMAKHSASNETEATTALRQAEAMMRKHDIEFADVEAQKIEKDDLQRGFTGETRNSKWVWNLAWAASYLTSTMPYKKGKEIIFCGVKEDVQVALLMHDYLVGVTEKISSKYRGKFDPVFSVREQRQSFKMGMVRMIVKRAEEIKKEREAEIASASVASSGKDLIVIKQALIKDKFNLSYRKATRSYITDPGAYDKGQEAGKSVGLNRQVNGCKDKMRLAS